MKRETALLALVFSTAVVAVAPAWGDYSAGRAAYLTGNYGRALKEYMADQSPKAMYEVGYMYAHGEGTAKDEKVAAEWYRKSAEKGFVLAQYRLAGLYANGVGVEKDLKEAAKWYKMAADKGFQPAKDALKRLEQAK